jgi:hypothetical protein
VSAVHEDVHTFPDLTGRWNAYALGRGALEPTGEVLRFATVDTTRRQVANAQIDDYQRLPRRRFPWRPPLTLTVRARFSHPEGSLCGTAGFGFWNDPFMMTGFRPPVLPRAIWFFYASPPSDMKLDLHAPGCGWKAATIDALRPAAIPWALAAPLAVPLMNVRPLYRRLWPSIQRSLGICESPLAVEMTAWHTYVIEWGTRTARFTVDGECVLACAASPGGPLGFVAWVDNQYLAITPWGRFRYGWLDVPGRQWMEVFSLDIVPSAEVDQPGLALGGE